MDAHLTNREAQRPERRTQAAGSFSPSAAARRSHFGLARALFLPRGRLTESIVACAESEDWSCWRT